MFRHLGLPGLLLLGLLLLPTANASPQVAGIETATPEGATIRIRADGDGDYPSLQEALDEAPEGATIMLSAGSYHQSRPLRVTRPISLIGDGANASVVVGDSADVVMSVAVSGIFRMADIGFHYQGEGPADVVVIEAGSIEISGCTFSGAVESPSRQSWAGLRIAGKTEGAVRDCLSAGNTGEGITVDGEATIRLESNRCTSNKGCGIAFIGSTSGEASENDCSGNGQAGIVVAGEACPVLRANVCRGNSLAGILFLERSAGLAWANDCSANSMYGIQVLGQAAPALESNTCTGNMDSGIAYFGSTAGTAKGNTCDENQKYGIYVGGQAAPTLESNTCTGNKDSGIAYLGSSGGTAKGNTCTGNEKDGISVAEQANPTLESNTCSTNKRDGINVTGSAHPSLLRNLCLDNGDDGIGFEEAALGNASGSVCVRNAWSGIWVSGTSQPRIEHSTCSENGIAGIAFFEDGGGEVSNTTLERNSIGILVGGTAHPTLIRCSVIDSGGSKSVSLGFPNALLREVSWWDAFVLVHVYDWPADEISPGFGVYAYGTSVLTMDSCEISGSMISGVRISGESSAHIANCRILNNAHGIELVDAARATVEDTASFENRYTAVDVSGTAQVVLERCELLRNLVGLRAQNSAGVVLRDTGVCDNTVGVLLEGSARADLLQASLCRSTCAPVALWGDAEISLAECQFLDNAVDDVLRGREPHGLAPGEAVSARIEAGGAAVSVPEGPPSPVEAVVDSIVEVWPSGRDPVTGKYWEFASNGVILDSGAIATVAHVFYGEDSGDPSVWLKLSYLEVVDADSQDTIYVTSDFLTGVTPHGVHPAAISTGRDLAVLYPASPVVQGPRFAPAIAPYDPVWAVGYTGFLETAETWRFVAGVAALPDRFALKMWVLGWTLDEKRECVYPDVFVLLPANSETVAGMSGSPVVNARGELVGVLMRTFRYGDTNAIGAARLTNLPELQPQPER